MWHKIWWSWLFHNSRSLICENQNRGRNYLFYTLMNCDQSTAVMTSLHIFSKCLGRIFDLLHPTTRGHKIPLILLGAAKSFILCQVKQLGSHVQKCISLSGSISLCEPDLRAQLTDQIKILDSQVEVKQQQLSDLSEFLRRRGDIEAEYARTLDKLTERFTHKTKKYVHTHTHTRPPPPLSWPALSCNMCFSSGRSSGVSLCVRSGPFCWLKRALRVASMRPWETPAATLSHSVWSMSQRTHTAYTNG